MLISRHNHEPNRVLNLSSVSRRQVVAGIKRYREADLAEMGCTHFAGGNTPRRQVGTQSEKLSRFNSRMAMWSSCHPGNEKRGMADGGPPCPVGADAQIVRFWTGSRLLPRKGRGRANGTIGRLGRATASPAQAVATLQLASSVDVSIIRAPGPPLNAIGRDRFGDTCPRHVRGSVPIRVPSQASSQGSIERQNQGDRINAPETRFLVPAVTFSVYRAK